MLQCSRNAHPQKGLVRRPQLEQHGCPAAMKLIPYKKEGERERKAARCPPCSQNAHDETVLARCAQSTIGKIARILRNKRWLGQFRGAWRGAGPSSFFGLSRLCGSTNERDKTAPPPDRLPLNRPLLTQRSHNPAVVVRFTTQLWTGRPLESRISLFFYPTKEIMSHQSIVSNLFGRHLCPFTPGFRKPNGNGLLSGFDSRATLPAL